MATHRAVTEFVASQYEAFASSWGDATAFPGYRPLPEGMPSSYGNCSTATMVMFKRLLDNFPEEGDRLRIAKGMVLRAAEAAGGAVLQKLTPRGHVWTSWNAVEWQRGGVICLTLSQGRQGDLPPWVVWSNEELEARGVVYRPEGDLYSSVEAFIADRSPAMRDLERMQILENRLGALTMGADWL